MATVTTSRTAAGVPARAATNGVFVDVATYEATALPIADVINFVNVPAGATVLDVRMVNDALGASSTLNIGDADSATYYLAATSTAAAATQRTAAFPKLYASGGVIRSVVAGAAITGTITVAVFMTMESTDLT